MLQTSVTSNKQFSPTSVDTLALWPFPVLQALLAFFAQVLACLAPVGTS